MHLTGLHHVTAITAQAAQNLAFYTQVLGLRLVKKSVNQDDISAYHLFYADALGSPGTDVTFFDWPHITPKRQGVGSVAEIALRLPDHQALLWWEQRLTKAAIPHQGIRQENGREILRFSDPDGQALALVNDDGAPDAGIPWERSPVPGTYAIRGLYGVRLLVRSLQPTAWILTEVMGFHQSGEFTPPDDPSSTVVVFETGRGGAGAQVEVQIAADLPPARQGWGGVHHVAFRTPDESEQARWQQRLLQAGLHVTRIIDRYYFKSIYFREPGGVLFEIATDGPGFTTDEDPDHLGERLALPPFLEPLRQQIELNLRPLPIEGLDPI